MAALKGSRTEQCLKDAFAGESQANRRYLYFANKADVEGQNDVAALFRSTAEGETGHAHGHLEFLEQSGDPATGYAHWLNPSKPGFSCGWRNPRVHRHVPRYGQDRSRRRLRRRSQIGLRPWPRPSVHTPTAIKKR